MNKKIISLFATMSLAVSSLFVTSPPPIEAATKQMKVHFIDVGQGDSIYIKAPNGEDILIDAGNGNGKKTIDYLKKQKVNDIEVMIATHPDADHMGGLNDVLKAYKVKSVYAPKVSHTTQVYKDFLKAVKTEKLTVKTAKKGVKLNIKGVDATFLAPVKSYAKSDLNNWSSVLKITYGKNTYLFTGDAEEKAEKDLIASKQNLKADVLKVGHHGAKTSTSADFLKKVNPKHAVISVGAKNNYGHPTSTILNRLKKNGTDVYRTDKQGSIVSTSDGKTVKFTTKPNAKGEKEKVYALKASVDNAKPKQNATINLNVSGVPSGTKYKAVFHYKSKDTTYTGKVGTPLPVKIGRAAYGYKVKIDVSATHNKKTYKTTTSFTPTK